MHGSMFNGFPEGLQEEETDMTSRREEKRTPFCSRKEDVSPSQPAAANSHSHSNLITKGGGPLAVRERGARGHSSRKKKERRRINNFSISFESVRRRLDCLGMSLLSPSVRISQIYPTVNNRHWKTSRFGTRKEFLQFTCSF